MTERILHQKGLVKPKLTEEQRKIFKTLLASFEIIPLALSRIAEGARDLSFSDLEDSFQYQSALQAGCDILLTLNIKDFKDTNQENIKVMDSLSVLSKFQFVEDDGKEE